MERSKSLIVEYVEKLAFYEEKPSVKKSRIETKVDLKYSNKLSDYLKPKKTIGQKIVSTQEKVQTEDQVIKACVLYLRATGWLTHTLFTGGIPIGNGKYATNPCKGIPDCIAFHILSNRMIWIEFKKSHGGLISYEQAEWHSKLKSCKQEIFIVNSLKSLKDQLNETL